MKTQYRCPQCNSLMNLVKENAFLDRQCFRCKKSYPKHDVKINIRKDIIFENIKINLI